MWIQNILTYYIVSLNMKSSRLVGTETSKTHIIYTNNRHWKFDIWSVVVSEDEIARSTTKSASENTLWQLNHYKVRNRMPRVHPRIVYAPISFYHCIIRFAMFCGSRRRVTIMFQPFGYQFTNPLVQPKRSKDFYTLFPTPKHRLFA